jgi:GNAT superfamily N-acetyltransferase
MEIRPFEQADAEGAARLLRTLVPYEPVTAQRLRQYHDCVPPRIAEQWWVTVDNDGLVGWGSAGLNLWTGARRVASLFVGVRQDRRGEGLGSRLYATASAHLHAIGAERVEVAVYGEVPETVRFLRRRGFRRARRAQVWSLDPARSDLADLPAREHRAVKMGFRLVPLRDLVTRPEAMYELYATTLRDVPADDAFDEVRFEEFLCYRFRDPMLDLDGSLVLVAGDDPVSYAWITVEEERRLGFNAMTGTLPAYRHRGLAKLVKAASIRWARENGVRNLYTSNDSTNVDMLAMNLALGYQPAGVWDTYSRPVQASRRPQRSRAAR